MIGSQLRQLDSYAVADALDSLGLQDRFPPRHSCALLYAENRWQNRLSSLSQPPSHKDNGTWERHVVE